LKQVEIVDFTSFISYGKTLTEFYEQFGSHFNKSKIEIFTCVIKHFMNIIRAAQMGLAYILKLIRNSFEFLTIKRNHWILPIIIRNLKFGNDALYFIHPAKVTASHKSLGILCLDSILE